MHWHSRDQLALVKGNHGSSECCCRVFGFRANRTHRFIDGGGTGAGCGFGRGATGASGRTLAADHGADRGERHEIQQIDGVWQARTPGQAYRTVFSESGPVFRLRDGEVTHEIGFALDAVSVDGQALAIKAPPTLATGNRFEYQRGVVTEWYVNDPSGVRQWFRVDEAPEGERLMVDLQMSARRFSEPIEGLSRSMLGERRYAATG